MCKLIIATTYLLNLVLAVNILSGVSDPFLTLSLQVLTVICVILWIVVAAGTIRGAISGKMFYAPCLGTDLHARKVKTEAKQDLDAEKAQE